MKPHKIPHDEEPNYTIAMVHPAAPDVVKLVLSKPTHGQDGRSEWVWVRLPNGDLILGVFPQGDTYFEVEDDARYPGD